ncbi:MAG: transcriptional repressor [Patescibacteria group bacterium]|nr:transcriptional repressor [Patescibacteria group bacterium]
MKQPPIRRKSRQRDVVLEELRAEASHPTARQLYDRVRRRLPHISLGTVYRNLDLLCGRGEIRRLAADGETRFDADTSHHDHVRCVRCGRVADLPAKSIQLPTGELDETAGYEIISYRLEYLGVCPACRDAAPSDAVECSPPLSGVEPSIHLHKESDEC